MRVDIFLTVFYLIDIIGVNIPTGVPLVYEFDKNLRPLRNYYLLNEEEL